MLSLNKITSALLICISVVAGEQAPVRDQNPVRSVEQQSRVSDWQPYPLNINARRSNRVHKAGLLWLNMTNMGGFGKMGSSAAGCPIPSMLDHSTGKFPNGGELPGGSGIEYLYGAGLYIGGFLDSVKTDNTLALNANGVPYFQGPLVSTGYEGWQADNGVGVGMIAGPCKEFTPTGFAPWTPGLISEKERIMETSNIMGRENVFGQQVHDPAASAHEQFTCWFTDWQDGSNYTNIDVVDKEIRPGRFPGEKGYHLPLGVEVKQTSYAWSSPFAQKFILIDYTIYNTNPTKSIYNMFIGMMFDCDVLGKSGTNEVDAKDDLSGFKQTAEIIDEATGTKKFVPINMCWVADNDGRDNSTSGPLNGGTSIASVRVLRNPNPALRYSFNMYTAGSGDGLTPSPIDEQPEDWGPRWKDGYHNKKKIYDPAPSIADSVFNPGWYGQYDINKFQRGYADGSLEDGWNIRQGVGGMTEGWPMGDVGRYMVMSNGEFDYDFIKLLEPAMANNNPNFNLGDVASLDLDAGIQKPEYRQSHKWQPYLDTDGDATTMKDLGNGADAKFILSFGPLGTDDGQSVKVATGNNTEVTKEKIWKIAPRDSVKLTIAFVVSEKFHYDPTQDGTSPIFTDSKVNWADAFRNANWADRLYDVPLTDTKVFKEGATKGDGWYGEDIGKDAIFSEVKGYKCWWNNLTYTNSDAGEGNGEIDSFTVVPFDGSATEDLFMKWANETPGAGALPDSIGPSSVYGYNDFPDPSNPGKYLRYGFGDLLSTRGDGVPDFSAPEAPPSPNIKVESEGRDVSITWTSDNYGKPGTSPEILEDKFSRISDFEGYKIITSESENIKDFVEIYSVDRVNYTYENLTVPGKYLDIPFDDDPNNPAPAILLPDSSATVVWKYENGVPVTIEQKNNTKNSYVKKAFDQNNSYRLQHEVPGQLSYIPTDKGNGVWEYKLILRNRIIGKSQFVSVVSTDFGFPKSDTDPLMSSPSMNRKRVVAARMSNTNKVTVIPNPYRSDVDYEKTKWEVVPDKWRESDRKIVFANVPRKSIIRIYTLAGDLVKTIAHNGLAKESKKHGDFSASWNLLNDNDQAVASGVYLFAVEDLDGNVDKYVSKFVIIK